MANDGSAQTDSVWPLPQFRFEVRLGEADPVSFAEVSGLDAGTDVIEYRHGDSKAFSSIKMPGLPKHGNVTMKRGLFHSNSAVWRWFNEISMNTIKAETVTISLLNENGAPVMVWTLSNAFPVKVTGADMKSVGNEIAVEAVELAYEAITHERG